jgi:hypothetical protein
LRSKPDAGAPASHGSHLAPHRKPARLAPGAPIDVPAVLGQMVEYHGGMPACHA